MSNSHASVAWKESCTRQAWNWPRPFLPFSKTFCQAVGSNKVLHHFFGLEERFDFKNPRPTPTFNWRWPRWGPNDCAFGGQKRSRSFSKRRATSAVPSQNSVGPDVSHRPKMKGRRSSPPAFRMHAMRAPRNIGKPNRSNPRNFHGSFQEAKTTLWVGQKMV